MNRALTVALCAVAILATLLAIDAGTNAGVAIPAGAAAATAGALLLGGIVERTRWPRVREMPTLREDPMRVRTMVAAGTLGRPSLIRLLDALQRTGVSPDASPASPEEIARLQGLSREKFREYLNSRVSDLERRT
jgi:hypothetical protein